MVIWDGGNNDASFYEPGARPPPHPSLHVLPFLKGGIASLQLPKSSMRRPVTGLERHVTILQENRSHH